MILDKVGLTGSWHKLQDWGMDILRTGNSLGAGGLAVKENGRLWPMADADTTYYRFAGEGPLQASFVMKFINWDTGASKTNGSERIILQKGDFFYQDEIQVSLNNIQKLVCGMPCFASDSLVFTRHNQQYSSVSTYAKQADGTASNLGLAIMFPAKEYFSKGKTGETDQLASTFFVELNPSRAGSQTVRFFACWEMTDKRFSTHEGFSGYLRETADRLSSPITVKVKELKQ